MYQTNSIPQMGTFSVGRITQTGNTAIAALVSPWQGPLNSPPMMYQYLSGAGGANWFNNPVAHVTSLGLLCGATAHTVYVMKPKNFTYFTAALAASTTAIPDTTLAGDPGLYQTASRYLYPLPSGVTKPNTANNAIAASDYVCYQLSDGSWQFDKIASGSYGSTLTLTTGTPSTATVPIYSPFFWFGAAGDTDPATNQVDFGFDTVASTKNIFQDYLVGIAQGMHGGDPLLFFDANATNADFLNQLSGFYGKF